ncbi:MAG TPA: hotdog fold thioesterase [Rhodocyclaceae bacterium]|nr:hotdog fold thioesterase [Rhodocyclaceae bacterium]
MNVFEESQGRLSGLEQLQAFIAKGRRPPIGDTLDFNLVEVEEGRAVFEGIPGKHAYNPLGSVHGGYAATLLDSACGCAVHSCLKAGHAYTTLELKIAYHRAMNVDTGPVRAEGKVITIGKRVAFAEARLTDAEGKIYASATSTLILMEQRKP